MPVAYRRPEADLPLPTPELAQRVSGSRCLDTFLSSGNVHANAVLRLLQPHMDPAAVRAFLDWGCGCGRITLHLARMLPDAKIHGTDVDARAIAWLSSAMPGGQFHATGESPPLPFDDDSFDLVLASSVFTHLSQADQEAWLTEVRRVMKLGGFLVATTHGWHTAAWYRFPEVTADMEERGFSDRMPDGSLGDVVSPDYYRTTFQTPDYTRSAWCTLLEEVAMIPAALNLHQDVWVLRKG